jgi:cell division transport system ATP-binding protein
MISFAHVTKKFGETAALTDVSFEVEKGELVLIIGPSGSGKTTLMRLLIKEYEPSEGEIIFDGSSLAKVRGGGVSKHRRRIGVVFQDYKLLPEMNVWENIALPLSIIGKGQAETESRVTDLLKLIGLTDKASLFPSQLSGGEAQRVSIARALATGPGIIFADEPTGNLDPETSLSIAKLLRQINKLGTTLLLATHDSIVLNILAGERKITLRKGELIDDTHAKTGVTEVRLSTEKKPSEATQKTEQPKPPVETSKPSKPTEPTSNEQDEDVVSSVEDLDDDAVEIAIKSTKKTKTAKSTDQDKSDTSKKEKKKGKS